MSTETETIALQETSTSQMEAPAPYSSGFMGMVPMLAIFFVFYFLLLRPQEKKRKQQEDTVSSVKKGEKVLTSSGIFGTVLKINENDNTILLQVAENVEIKMLKTSIVDITSRSAIKPASKKSEKKDLKKKKK